MPLHRPTGPLSRLATSFLLLGAGAIGVLACAGRSTDTAGCTAIPSSELTPGTSAATGSVTASNLTAALCPGGASARVLSAGAAYDTSPYFFELSSNVSGSGFAADFAFQSPSGANGGEILVNVGLPSLSPGTYTGSASPACGDAAFSYSLPVPPSVDCDGGTDTQCPTGCGRTCPAFGCQGIPCEAQAPMVSYSANGATDCSGNATSPLGSWTLTLSSVTATDGGTSKYNALFTPHGSLTMSLPASGGGTDVAQLSATF